MLSRSEKILYHQIHPLKLAVDVTGGLASTWLFWQHSLVVGVAVAFLPSVLVTLAMLRWMDFERQQESALGRYLAFHMTHAAEAVRFAGQGVMWVGAWLGVPWVIVAGAAVIILGWTYSIPAWRAQARRAQ